MSGARNCKVAAAAAFYNSLQRSRLNPARRVARRAARCVARVPQQRRKINDYRSAERQ